MCYASWTKGTAAQLIALRDVARHFGVDDALLAEWDRSQPGLRARSNSAAASTAAKAWRFIGEMEEVAATFSAAGEPSGFGLAAAEVYRGIQRQRAT